MSKTLASRDFELGFPSFISSSLILVDIMIVLRVMGFRGRCIRNIQGSHCKKSFRTCICNNTRIHFTSFSFSQHKILITLKPWVHNCTKHQKYMIINIYPSIETGFCKIPRHQFYFKSFGWLKYNCPWTLHRCVQKSLNWIKCIN